MRACYPCPGRIEACAGGGRPAMASRQTACPLVSFPRDMRASAAAHKPGSTELKQVRQARETGDRCDIAMPAPPAGSLRACPRRFGGARAGLEPFCRFQDRPPRGRAAFPNPDTAITSADRMTLSRMPPSMRLRSSGSRPGRFPSHAYAHVHA